MESPIITLTTDWGYHDFFAGMVKGRLYASIPNVRVVDITHGLEPFQLGKTIFAVRNACMGFPAGTIHIIDATNARNDNNPYVVVEHNKQYYICMDNGLPRALFGDDACRAVVITAVEYGEADFRTFAAYDIFCRVAAMIASGASLEEIGSPLEAFCPFTPNRPVYSNDKLKLSVGYIDDYGNATLNITLEEFNQLRAGRRFEMIVRENILTEVVSGYAAARDAGNGRGALLLTVSISGYLQVAMRQYSAQQYFGLREHDSIFVRFL